MDARENSRATILLVEDDPTVAAMLKDRLEARGYRVWHAASAAEAEAMAGELHLDLVILDLMLPDAHGLVLCAELKEKQAAPIIICSGTKRKDDAALGFKLGADDFVAKPFSVGELEARIEATLRRPAPRVAPGSPSPPGEQHIGALVIDRARCRVTLGAEVVRPTPTEYRLLCALRTARTRACRDRSWRSASGATTTPASAARWTCTCAACAPSSTLGRRPRRRWSPCAGSATGSIARRGAREPQERRPELPPRAAVPQAPSAPAVERC